jgi:hypothetical protein
VKENKQRKKKNVHYTHVVAVARGYMQSGQIKFINEVADDPTLVGQSFRLIGTLNHIDATENRAQIEHRGRLLDVDTTLLGQFPFHIGSLFQFIGEMNYDEFSKKLVLKARVGRNIDGLDMGLYEQALKIRREFLQ